MTTYQRIEVVASKNPAFAVGDKVFANLGWAEMGVSDGSGMRKVDADKVPCRPISAW